MTKLLLIPTLTLTLAAASLTAAAQPVPLGSVLESELELGVPLQIPRREPGSRFAWSAQFTGRPGAPGDQCLEGQYAWDAQFLFTCVPPGRWIYFEPDLY